MRMAHIWILELNLKCKCVDRNQCKVLCVRNKVGQVDINVRCVGNKF